MDASERFTAKVGPDVMAVKCSHGRLNTETCGICDSQREVFGEALADRNKPDPLRLDPDDPGSVERLARALHETGLNTIGKKPGSHGPYTKQCICWMDARIIARTWKESK